MHTISLLDYNLYNAIVNVDAFESIAFEDRFLVKFPIEFNVGYHFRLFSKLIYRNIIFNHRNLLN